jgi:hypothetical protein
MIIKRSRFYGGNVYGTERAKLWNGGWGLGNGDWELVNGKI